MAKKNRARRGFHHMFHPQEKIQQRVYDKIKKDLGDDNGKYERYQFATGEVEFIRTFPKKICFERREGYYGIDEISLRPWPLEEFRITNHLPDNLIPRSIPKRVQSVFDLWKKHKRRKGETEDLSQEAFKKDFQTLHHERQAEFLLAGVWNPEPIAFSFGSGKKK